MANERSQQVPHDFIICDRDGECCFWPGCHAHGCMAGNEPKDNLVLHSDGPDQKPVILDTSNL